MAQRPIIWAAGFAGAAALVATVYGERLAQATGVDSRPAPPSATAASKPTLTVAADYRGHYLVHPTIENFRLRMMVDTGATMVALTAADARAVGLSPRPGDYRVPLSTANGTVMGARVVLREIRLGDIVVRHVDAVVLPAGALSTSLLGNSFLHKLQGYEVRTGRMVLRG